MDINISANILTRHDVFATLLEHELEIVAATAEKKILRRGQMLFEQDEEASHIGLVLSGSISAVHQVAEGRPSLIDHYGPGDLIEPVLIYAETYAYGYMASKSSDVLIVTTKSMRKAITEVPLATGLLMMSISKKVTKEREASASLLKLSCVDRVKYYLWTNSEKTPDGRRRCKLVQSAQGIADHISCSREMVSRCLSDMEKTGEIIRNKDTGIILTKLFDFSNFY